MSNHLFLSGRTSWRENLRFIVTALRLVGRKRQVRPVPSATLVEVPQKPDQETAHALVIRYDHVLMPGKVKRWVQLCRHPAHRGLGAAAFAELTRNSESTAFLDCLRWGAMSLYVEGMDDQLNQIAIQSQRELSAGSQNPVLKAYADFAALLWSPQDQPHAPEHHLLTTGFPTWMADDLLLLNMARAQAETERVAIFNRLLNDKGLTEVELLQPGIEPSPAFDRLKSRDAARAMHAAHETPLVSVIVPVYNAGSTLHTAVASLLKQSWTKLEIIAVNDASTDGSGLVLDAIAARDSRVRVVHLPENAGAYSARNAGLAVARGQFATVADSDDWHHPQKIEQQCRHLMTHSDVVANMSAGFRSDEDLKPLARHRPFFKHVNLSSLMFRREPVVRALGGWNAVRFGADTEFYNRLEIVFGKQALFSLDLPLFIARVREGSLTNDPLHGYFGHNMGARKEYVECYHHHQRCATVDQLRYPLDPAAILPFPVPAVARRQKVDTQKCDLVYAGDLRDPAQAMRAIRHQREGRVRERLVRLLHIQTFDLQAQSEIAPFLRDYLYKWNTTLLTQGEPVSTKLLLCHHSVCAELVSSQYPAITFTTTQIDDLQKTEPDCLFPVGPA